MIKIITRISKYRSKFQFMKIDRKRKPYQMQPQVNLTQDIIIIQQDIIF
ncbi:hypothetical protein pb186bvf_016535 [Paramecium bursaria]